MRKFHLIFFMIILMVITLGIFNYLIDKDTESQIKIRSLKELEREIDIELKNSAILKEKIKQLVKGNTVDKKRQKDENVLHDVDEDDETGNDVNYVRHVENAIAVLILACNRITVSRSLDQLIKYRPSRVQFPIIVSQDCRHEETEKVIKSYGKEVHYISQPNQNDISVPPKEKKFKGYYKIARHYGWALNETFLKFGFKTAIIVEDDLDISPDFYEYFGATYPLLRDDPSLWCVSAWNDNGKLSLIDINAKELLYRTDFFPGLGWMLTKSLWQELMTKWPTGYWDDWIRHPSQRKDRSCIRPEISRTRTFGKIGVSNGLYYEKYLKHIYLNERLIEFTALNLTYLMKSEYDPNFLSVVYNSPVVSYQELKSDKIYSNGPIRLLYNSKSTFKKLSKLLGLMDDFRSGVPRTAYFGIISFVHRKRRVFLTPDNGSWSGYDPTW